MPIILQLKKNTSAGFECPDDREAQEKRENDSFIYPCVSLSWFSSLRSPYIRISKRGEQVLNT